MLTINIDRQTTEVLAFEGSKEELDKLIEWKAGSIAVLKHYKLDTITRGAHMQRQFTMELRVDFADKDKLPVLIETFRQAACHVNATAQLISDNPKSTQIVVYSDDFFAGHQEIALLDDVIQQGLDAVGETSGSDTISDELAGAINGR